MKALTITVYCSYSNVIYAPRLRVKLNGHFCSTDVLYIENLFYYLKNGVMPLGRIPNMKILEWSLVSRNYFDSPAA